MLGTLAVLQPAWAQIRVEDQRGKSLTLAQPASRIVTIPIPMAAIVMAGSAAAAALLGRDAARDRGRPPPGYLVYDYALGMVAALGGGWVAARLAPALPLQHAMVLGMIVLVMSVACAYAWRDSGPPRWYQAALSVSAAAVVMAGAWLAAQGA